MNILLPSNAVLSVRRTTRKDSVALKVTHERNTLLVPRSFSERRLQSFLHKQLDWIEQSIAKQRACLPTKPLMPTVDLHHVVLFGQTYQIAFDESIANCFWQTSESRVLVPKSAQKQPGLVKNTLKKALFEVVESYLKQQTLACAERMGVRCRLQSIVVKNYKSRWGSCTHDGRLQFNWRLAMFDKSVIEYVIVHELAHLTHLNHSKAFWAEVAQFCPDYKTHQTTLKQQGFMALNF